MISNHSGASFYHDPKEPGCRGTVAPSSRGPSKEIDVDDSQNRDLDFDQERRWVCLSGG